jgi:hypothetical protein
MSESPKRGFDATWWGSLCAASIVCEFLFATSLCGGRSSASPWRFSPASSRSRRRFDAIGDRPLVLS